MMAKDHFSSEFMELDRRCGKRHGGNMKTLKTSPAALFANFEESMEQIAERFTKELSGVLRIGPSICISYGRKGEDKCEVLWAQ